MVIPSVQQAQATPSAVLVTADQVTAGPVTAEVEEASSKRFIAELLTYGLHLVSSIVVLGIVIYLIYVYTHTGLEMFLSMLVGCLHPQPLPRKLTFPPGLRRHRRLRLRPLPPLPQILDARSHHPHVHPVKLVAHSLHTFFCRIRSRAVYPD